MNKRVLILVNHDIVVYNFRKELVDRLLWEGYDVYISSPKGERINDLIQSGCKYIETKVDRHGINIFHDLKLLIDYIRIINKIKPTMVLTYTIKPNIYGGAASRLLKYSYIQNITGLGCALKEDGLLSWFIIGLYKYSLSLSQCVFFQNSENLRFFIDKRIVKDNYKLIPGSGVNVDQFTLLDYPVGAPLLDGSRTIEFAFISRVMKDKGINEYLEAAKSIKDKYPYTRFHICGFCEAEYKENLKELQHNQYITYHGMVSNIKNILKDIHCVVLPSYHEGMSNALLEAAASGRPLLASDIPGCREIIDEGINGFKFNVGDTGALENAIERFLELSYENKKNMGIAGRNKMVEEFDRKIVVQAYMNEIQEDRGEK